MGTAAIGIRTLGGKAGDVTYRLGSKLGIYVSTVHIHVSPSYT